MPATRLQEAALQLMLGHRDAALALFDKAVDGRIERKLAEMRQRVDFSTVAELAAPARN